MSKIWVIDDDRSIRKVLLRALHEAGLEAREFDSADAAFAALDEGDRPDVALTDIRMPGRDGLTLLEALQATVPPTPTLVVSAYTDVANTAAAFRGGAVDFISKPFDIDNLIHEVGRLLTARAEPAARNTPPANAKAEPARLTGDAAPMQALFRTLGRVAQTSLAVLVVGETGTGKELVARALHRESPRAHKPFVAINTAAIPADLLEAELFGYEAGAFTGATARHRGRFEQAHGGTLFLDEVGDMPAALQSRLLRVLAEDEFFRVGGRELVRVDTRIIAATHQNLDELVSQGRFRADLLHRLDVVRLQVPPLRDRRSDIAALAQSFMTEASAALGVPRSLSAEALQQLAARPWPGNVRQLRNLCFRVAAMTGTPEVTAADIDAERDPVRSRESLRSGESPWHEALRGAVSAALAEQRDGIASEFRAAFDRVMIEAALDFTGGRREEAARRLGIGRNTLSRRISP